MSTESYLQLPGDEAAAAIWTPSNWLPRRAQVVSAVQLQIDEVIGATGREDENEADVRTTSMRQGIGLVFVLGLAAGLLPFLVNWFNATRAGTALPLLRFAQQWQQIDATGAEPPFPFGVWIDTARTVAGLEPRLPGWLAAFFSALGEWINQPLSWLALWLVYGLGILIVSHIFGGRTTLQRFYAATAYAFTPLLLTVLTPIPCLGALATFVAVIWMIVLYTHAVQVVTELDLGRALLSVLLPGALALLFAIVAGGAFIVTIIRVFFGML